MSQFRPASYVRRLQLYWFDSREKHVNSPQLDAYSAWWVFSFSNRIHQHWFTIFIIIPIASGGIIIVICSTFWIAFEKWARFSFPDFIFCLGCLYICSHMGTLISKSNFSNQLVLKSRKLIRRVIQGYFLTCKPLVYSGIVFLWQNLEPGILFVVKTKHGLSKDEVVNCQCQCFAIFVASRVKLKRYNRFGFSRS